jgi:hypothetical protein
MKDIPGDVNSFLMYVSPVARLDVVLAPLQRHGYRESQFMCMLLASWALSSRHLVAYSSMGALALLTLARYYGALLRLRLHC